MRTYIELANFVATDETKPRDERLRLWKHYIQLAYEESKQYKQGLKRGEMK